MAAEICIVLHHKRLQGDWRTFCKHIWDVSAHMDLIVSTEAILWICLCSMQAREPRSHQTPQNEGREQQLEEIPDSLSQGLS